MLREGHLGIGLLMYAPFAFGFIFFGYYIIAGIGLLFTLVGVGIPDMDTKLSIVKHRGFTHTIWAAILASLISMAFILVAPPIFGLDQYLVITPMTTIIGGLFAGYGVISHLVGDIITPHGIRPFHPLTPREIIDYEISNKKYVFEITNAKNSFYNTTFLVIGCLSITFASIGAAILL